MVNIPGDKGCRLGLIDAIASGYPASFVVCYEKWIVRFHLASPTP